MSTDYSKMSDFEINKIICDVFWRDLRKSPECENKSFPQNTSIVYMHNGYGGFSRDYCNNPADAWPIIIGNKLWLRELYGQWHVCGFPTSNPNNVIKYFHENPLRAAMVLFLMMQDSKNAS